MADEAKIGTHWRDDELDAIVADYFVMLASDLAGQPYVKSRHSATLMAQIGRTHRSVEFKHQNISAVLDELGMPWIPGYKPKRNYQNAIFDAIDRYLSSIQPLLCLSRICRSCCLGPPKFLSHRHHLAGRPSPFLSGYDGLSRSLTLLIGTIATVLLAKPARHL